MIFCMVENSGANYNQLHGITHYPTWQNEVRFMFNTGPLHMSDLILACCILHL